MKGKAFLIHWNASEAEEHSKRLRAYGWDLDVESRDGARAFAFIKEARPDVVVIYLTRLPSHGCATAHALRSLKATRDLPIVFVGGNEESVEKVRSKVPDGIFIAPEELEKAMAGFFKIAVGC